MLTSKLYQPMFAIVLPARLPTNIVSIGLSSLDATSVLHQQIQLKDFDLATTGILIKVKRN